MEAPSSDGSSNSAGDESDIVSDADWKIFNDNLCGHINDVHDKTSNHDHEVVGNDTIEMIDTVCTTGSSYILHICSLTLT
jgi:hypothetical protein